MGILTKVKKILQLIKSKLQQLDRKQRTALLVLFLSFLALSTATYAWIVASLNASLTAATMTTRIYGNFSIAQGKYETIGELTPGAFKKSVAFADHPEYSEKEISSNGQVFYTWENTTKDPETNKPLGFTAIDTSVATLDANEEKDFIAQDFTFLASEDTNIYLTSDSVISNEGPFASNIAPAARVAFYEWDSVNDEYDFKYMWAPNTAQITNGNKSGNIKYISDTNGTETTTNGLAYTNAGLPTVGGFIYSDEEADYAPPVTTITATEPTLKTIQVRIWLEGTDDAAVDANLEDNKGQWKVDLRFSSGIQIKPSPYKENIGGVLIQPNTSTLGMIPVTYDASGNAIVADVTTAWFSYANKQWANAVSVSNTNKSQYIDEEGNYASGTTVNASHIMAHFVYIPRYSYTIRCTSAALTSCYGQTGVSTYTAASSAATPGIIQAKFVTTATKETNAAKYYATAGTPGTSSTTMYTLPAFTFGAQELPGIWVGKFETTGNATTPTIKPNSTSLRSQNAATQFATSLKFAGGSINTSTGVITWPGTSSTYGIVSGNAHMMKNEEWAAVAYLAQSQYGNGATRIGTNNNSNYTTGCGATAGTAASSSCNAWTTTDGQKASTTGNLYGVYDMSGGALENVMAHLLSSSNKIVSYTHQWYNEGMSCEVLSQGTDYFKSGFKGTTYYFHETDGTDCGVEGYWSSTTFPAETTGTTLPDVSYYQSYSSNDGKGHATYETSGWYGNSATWLTGENYWLTRGGLYSNPTTNGALAFSTGKADAPADTSFRVTLIPLP